MEAMPVLHMNKGDGETSYAKNSGIQNKIQSIAKPVMDEAVLTLLWPDIPKNLVFADLGCSSGPNALKAVSEIIDIVYQKCSEVGHPVPEFRVFLNDLPCNDFNCVFGSLPAFYNKLKHDKGAGFGPCFVAAMPGSFYGRLFPSRSLHFVHSSSSLHWLSQVPPGLESTASILRNKGKIFISPSSPQCVLDAYAGQFRRDFSTFLKSRAEEIVAGGSMVLSFMGRSSLDHTTPHSCFQWELLAQALMSMVSEGLIDEDKVDSFNAPYYAPCPEEIILEVEKDGSFIINRLETFEIRWDGGVEEEDVFAKESFGKRVAKIIRAVVESMLESHFGGHIMDGLFQRYADIVDDYHSKFRTSYINVVISMVRKDSLEVTQYFNIFNILNFFRGLA